MAAISASDTGTSAPAGSTGVVIAGTACGVLLPKVGPAFLAPAGVGGGWAGALRTLAAATVGALAGLTALGPRDGGHFRPEVALAAAVAVSATLLLRRVRRRGATPDPRA